MTDTNTPTNAGSRAAAGSAGRGSKLGRKGRALARKIANDVSEGIDGGESREMLRLAVSYWADVACMEATRRAAAESRLKICALARDMMAAVLPPNAPRSATEGRP